MRCPNCGEETWGEGGVCDYCGATLRGQPGRPSGKDERRQANRPQPERGGWKQVPASDPPPPRVRGARQRAQEAKATREANAAKERRPSTLGDLFGRSGPPPADRADGGMALPRYGPQSGPPTPRRGAPMAASPPTPSRGRWRVSPEEDA